MSATSFIRRASGLLVPKMSLAAPWLWIPCADCGCGEGGGDPCTDNASCINGTPRQEYINTLAGMSNDDCTSCGDFNDSYTVADTVTPNIPDPWLFNTSVSWWIDISAPPCFRSVITVLLDCTGTT